jgi:Na+-driven multidrug efflux pump
MNKERILFAAILLSILSSLFSWISYQVCEGKDSKAKNACNNALSVAFFVASLALASIEYAASSRSSSGPQERW